MTDHDSHPGRDLAGDAVEPSGITSPLQVRLLGALLALACLYTLYLAKTLLMPAVIALLFALLLSPLVGQLKRFHVPRTVSAITLLLAIGGPLTLLGTELAEPAKKWVRLLPELSVTLTEQLDSLSQALQPETEMPPEQAAPAPEPRWYNLFGLLSGGEEDTAPVPEARGESALSIRLMQSGLELGISVLGAAPAVIAQFLVGVILALFLLIFGPRLFEAFIDVIPQVQDKRRAVLLVGGVQRKLSSYILTVSIINCALGATTALALWASGVEDALLWGALVGLLNFAPYIGPLIAACILAVAGSVQYGAVLTALLPALIYLGINLIEAYLVTPTVLGQRMQLNPLILMVWLITWGWLWGAGGVLLAVPLLVCLKLAAEQLDVLDPWVRLLETRG